MNYGTNKQFFLENIQTFSMFCVQQTQFHSLCMILFVFVLHYVCERGEIQVDGTEKKYIKDKVHGGNGRHSTQ